MDSAPCFLSIFDRSSRTGLRVARRVRAVKGAPAQRLYRQLHTDTLTHTHTHTELHTHPVCVCVCVADPHLNNRTKPALPPFSAQINRNTLFLFVMNATHLHIRKRERERKTKHEPNLHIDPKLTNGNEGNRIFQRHEMLISIFR